MEIFNIYLSGVGGQGIGLLSEIILRAADHAGHKVKAVDTHGLAQRGGIVVSQIRLGPAVQTPLVPELQADLVVSLERHEALRALTGFARPGGILIYYDTVWQPLGVRLGTAPQIDGREIETLCRKHSIRLLKIFQEDLADSHMQNIVLLAHMARENLVPKISAEHYLAAMDDLMAGQMLEKNSELFQTLQQTS